MVIKFFFCYLRLMIKIFLLCLLSFPILAQADDSTVLVPKKFKICKENSDCQLVSVACSCCGLDAIAKKFSPQYEQLAKSCTLEPPCDCTPPNLTAVCKNKICTTIATPEKSPLDSSKKK